MPAPTNTLLIEGTFTELCEEFAQYLDSLRKDEGSSLHAEIAPLLEPLRQQEQNGEEPNLQQRDEVLKKVVAAATALNAAPEKGRTKIPDRQKSNQSTNNEGQKKRKRVQ
jgi:translation initiation factor 3 subunit M